MCIFHFHNMQLPPIDMTITAFNSSKGFLPVTVKKKVNFNKSHFCLLLNCSNLFFDNMGLYPIEMNKGLICVV